MKKLWSKGLRRKAKLGDEVIADYIRVGRVAEVRKEGVVVNFDRNGWPFPDCELREHKDLIVVGSMLDDVEEALI